MPIVQIRIEKQKKDACRLAAEALDMTLTRWIIETCERYMFEISPIERFEEDLANDVIREINESTRAQWVMARKSAGFTQDTTTLQFRVPDWRRARYRKAAVERNMNLTEWINAAINWRMSGVGTQQRFDADLSKRLTELLNARKRKKKNPAYRQYRPHDSSGKDIISR